MLAKKYEIKFKFYEAKPINELLSNSPSLTVAQFKEWLFIDDAN